MGQRDTIPVNQALRALMEEQIGMLTARHSDKRAIDWLYQVYQFAHDNGVELREIIDHRNGVTILKYGKET